MISLNETALSLYPQIFWEDLNPLAVFIAEKLHSN